MADKSIRRTIVEVAVESTYGVDPGGPYTPILTLEGASITPNSTLITRNTYKSSFAAEVPVVGAKWFDVSLPVEWRGSTSVNVTPEWGYLMRGCQMREVDDTVCETGRLDAPDDIQNGPFMQGEMLRFNGSTNWGRLGGIWYQEDNRYRLFVYDVENQPLANDIVTGQLSGASGQLFGSPNNNCRGYVPTSERQYTESLTMRFNYEGIRYVSTGVYLSWAFDGTNQQNPTLTFTGQGLYATPTDQASPTVTYQIPKPLPFFDAKPWLMTPDGAEVDMSKIPIQQITLAQNNSINQNEDIAAATGINSYSITDRAMSGAMNPAMSDLADFNPFSAWETSGQNYFGFSLDRAESQGTTIICSVGNAIWQNPTIADRNDIVVYNLPFTAADGGDGDGEITWWLYA